MLSFEEREGQEALDKTAHLKHKYGPQFGDLWTTLHPDIEVKSKASHPTRLGGATGQTGAGEAW